MGTSGAWFPLTAGEFAKSLLNETTAFFTDLANLANTIAAQVSNQAQTSNGNQGQNDHANELNYVNHVNLRQNGTPR